MGVKLRNSEDRVNSLEKENNKLLSDLGELKSVNGVLESKISEMGVKLRNSEDRVNSLEKEKYKELNSKVYELTSSIYESKYLNGEGRSFRQKLISRFPRLYILFNRKNNGLKNTLINFKGYKSIKDNKLFDLGYYLITNSDVRLSGMDPLLHYIYYGFKEGRNPNPDFDGNYYLETYSDVKNSNLNPLIHYSLYGKYEGRLINKKKEVGSNNKMCAKKRISDNNSSLISEYRIIKNSGLFDEKWYVKKYELHLNDLDPIKHYLTIGAAEDFNPNPLFDVKWYMANHVDIAKSKQNPLIHFIKWGESKNFDPHPLFDLSWYRNQLDCNCNVNLLLHYIEEGYKEKFDPHPLFSTSNYLENSSVSKSGSSNPLIDYLENKRLTGFKPHPSFIPDKSTISKIPKKFRYKLTTSPILSRVPPSLYLRCFLEKKKLHRDYCDIESYLRRAMVNPNLVNRNLSENDIRIISMMDQQKRILSDKYANRNQKELVSIIMPTCNRANIITDSIISVLAQTYRNWELIIIDDGGTDNTENVVNEFNDNRIRYERLDSGQGNAAARNLGQSLAKGSIISYLDDDDIWDPDTLLISVNALRDSNRKTMYSAQIVWEGFNNILRIGNRFKFLRFAPFNRSLLENANYISMISFVHDRSLIDTVGGFDESLNRYVDWDLILRYTEKEIPLALPCILSHYFQGRDNLSVSKVEDQIDNLQILRRRMIERSCWKSNLYMSNNENHVIFGISDITKKKRASKLSKLSKEEVEIIIPNYESIDVLTRCINSIAKNTLTPHNILICDNNSSEETRNRLDELCNSFENVEWIKVDAHTGFSYSVNAGLDLVLPKNNDIVILNNDTIVTPNWLEELKLILEENNDVGMVVPRQVLLAGNSISKAHVPATMNTFEVDINLSFHHDNILDPQFNSKENLVEVRYAPFFCNLIRHESAIKTGLLDTKNGPHFRSDWIYCDNLRRKVGRKIVYTPYSKVYHIQGVSTNLIKNKLPPI